MSIELQQEKKLFLPERNKIKEVYDSYSSFLNEILKNVESDLKQKLNLRSKPNYKSRVKSFPSYYRKILRVKKPEELATSESLICITDIIGIRIICPFLEDLSVVEEQVKELYNVLEIEHKGNPNNFKEFGYESVHILIKIPESCLPQDNLMDIPSDLVCELQVRTILQDAWAEVEHELIYKSEFSPFDMPLRRKLASMNASLSLADIIFQEIRDYQNKLQVEMDERRQTFYLKADNLTSEVSDSDVSENTNIQRVSPFVRGTIDDLILEALHEHNAGHFEKAIEIYTTVLSSKPQPPAPVLTVMHKHRGMAYFAKNDFDLALDDFRASYENDPDNFRALYYEGIVYSIKGDYKKAIEVFTESLKINEYQSHTLYRRALSYYNLGQYEKALSDLNDSMKLGLDNEETKNLHAKLIEKFDMNV